MHYYAGIGARKTPNHISKIMLYLGSFMAQQGWTLRSGAAQPAGDCDFEQGCDNVNGDKEIYLPWRGFNHHQSELHPKNYPFSEEEKEFAARFHPRWNKLGPSERLLMQRNTRELLGVEAIHGEKVIPVKCVICWTPNGSLVGGTAQALRIAEWAHIPVFNMGLCATPHHLEEMLSEIGDFVTKVNNELPENPK